MPGGEPSSTGENEFTDNLSGSRSYDAVAWAAANGLLRMDDSGHINSKNDATRAEVAYMLYQQDGTIKR